MIADLTPQQALCLHLMHSLALGYTLPSERSTPLALIQEHIGSLPSPRFDAVRAGAAAMMRAKTPVEWTFATNEVGRELVGLHKAEACRMIAVLSTKRVA